MRHILIVDDAREIVYLFQKIFEANKFRVTVAQDGATALKAIENNPVDGVVTDFRMPDMNGVELLARIRETQPDIPAIIVSSSPNEISPQGGRTDVFSKPVLPRQLVYRMTEMLIAVEVARDFKSSE